MNYCVYFEEHYFKRNKEFENFEDALSFAMNYSKSEIYKTYNGICLFEKIKENIYDLRNESQENIDKILKKFSWVKNKKEIKIKNGVLVEYRIFNKQGYLLKEFKKSLYDTYFYYKNNKLFKIIKNSEIGGEIIFYKKDDYRIVETYDYNHYLRTVSKEIYDDFMYFEKNGITKIYDRKGNIKSVEKYSMGKLEYIMTYYKNKTIKIYCEYFDDYTLERNGEYTAYYKNGNIAIEGRYHMGLKIGEWKIYNKKGELKSIKKYS